MGNTARKLSEKANKLPPLERMELVDKILASLDRPDKNLDQLWAREAEDRLAAWRRGKIKAVDMDEVLAKYR